LDAKNPVQKISSQCPLKLKKECKISHKIGTVYALKMENMNKYLNKTGENSWINYVSEIYTNKYDPP
jgi:hypothetical protein